jgi:hypothetical protein
MEHLQGVNRKPLKDELLPQGPKRGNLTALEDPHSYTSLFVGFTQEKDDAEKGPTGQKRTGPPFKIKLLFGPIG